MDVHKIIEVLNNRRALEILEHISEKKFEVVKRRYPKSTFYTIVRSLRDSGLIERADTGFKITSMGLAYLSLFKKVVENFNVLATIFENYPDHVIFFPDEFFVRLHELGEFEIITATDLDILKPVKTYMDNLVKSTEIYRVSPIYLPEWLENLKSVIENVNIVEVILTDEYIDMCVKYIEENGLDKIRLYRIDFNPYIAFTVTDVFLSIGFYKTSGDYDFSKDLISTSESALRFGRDLFKHFKGLAERVYP
jgi:predicted transcriptional regulator